jgi:hypothetical protein
VPEQPFRKLSLNRLRFSRTPFPDGATDIAMGKTETINPRQGAYLRRTTMLRKITLALVAAASLSAVALAPSAASAGWGGGWGGFHHFHGFHHFGGYRVGYGGYGDGGGCYVTRGVFTPWGYRLRTFNVCY